MSFDETIPKDFNKEKKMYSAIKSIKEDMDEKNLEESNHNRIIERVSQQELETEEEDEINNQSQDLEEE
jgi:hypothetical protein